jgi:2-polyprenyl-3-methyl-5-hydroxy-6-metoxy-1,4-benzoquinol methylase
MAHVKNLLKEGLVKELYEKYPYPSRKINDKTSAQKYATWVSKILDEKNSFWKGKKVLELGCGTGELANGLSLCGANVYAIDFSSSSIKKAKELSEKLGTNVTFEEKNILNFKSTKSDAEKYDVVIALGSLHHTINAKKGFHIACNCTTKEGIVIIGLYNKYSRFKHRMKRMILKVLAGNDFEKRMHVGEKIFGGNKSPAWLADKYGQAHESYHSISEILKWFREEEIELLASKPKFKRPFFDEIKWLIKKQNAFFVMVGKRNNLKKTSPF